MECDDPTDAANEKLIPKQGEAPIAQQSTTPASAQAPSTEDCTTPELSGQLS